MFKMTLLGRSLIPHRRPPACLFNHHDEETSSRQTKNRHFRLFSTHLAFPFASPNLFVINGKGTVMASQIGAQLYTLRDYLKTPADIAKTLARVRKLGYEAVQVSGAGPIDPAELAKILKNEGLACG